MLDGIPSKSNEKYMPVYRVFQVWKVLLIKKLKDIATSKFTPPPPPNNNNNSNSQNNNTTTTAKIQKINLKIIHTLSILTSHTVCVSQLIGLRGWGIRGCEMQQPRHGFILRWIIHCAVMLLLWFPHPRAVMTEAILYIYKY